MILEAVSIFSSVAGGILGAVGAKKEAAAKARMAQFEGEAKARQAELAGEAKAQGYEADAKAYMYKAGVASMNKQLKLQDADYSRWTGDFEAQQSGMKTKANLSRIKTAQASSGLDVNFGSAVGVRDSVVDIGQHEQAVIRANAARRAYGFEVEAAGQEAESTLGKMAAESSIKAADTSRSSAKEIAELSRRGGSMAAGSYEEAGNINAMKSIVGATGSVANKWLQGSQLGMWD